MPIDALFCAREYYTLESLSVVVMMGAKYGMKSHERLVNDILDFKQEYATKLAKAIFDYTVLVVYGEMRHGYSKSSHYHPDIPKNEGRYGAYQLARKYEPYSILRVGKELFSKSWGASFGGEKWARIAEKVLLRPIIVDAVFCDMCFSLSHNSAPYFDKYQSDIFYINHSGEYKKFLDLKFQGDILAVIQDSSLYVGFKLKQLLERARNLGFLPPHYQFKSSKNSEKAEEYILSYEHIRWGTTVLPNELIEKNRNYSDDCDEDEEEYDEQEEEEEEEGLYEKYPIGIQYYQNINPNKHRVQNKSPMPQGVY
jgi:hypothetical protein